MSAEWPKPKKEEDFYTNFIFINFWAMSLEIVSGAVVHYKKKLNYLLTKVHIPHSEQICQYSSIVHIPHSVLKYVYRVQIYSFHTVNNIFVVGWVAN